MGFIFFSKLFQKAEKDLGKNILKSKQLNICNTNLPLEPGDMHSKGGKKEMCYFCSPQKGEIPSKSNSENRNFLEAVCPF